MKKETRVIIVLTVIIAIIIAIIIAVNVNRGNALGSLWAKCEALMQLKQIKGICPNTVDKLKQRIKEYEAL